MRASREEFEEWFLALNYDFTREKLSRIGNGKYFYTTTKALWEQYQEIKKLKCEIARLERFVELGEQGIREVNKS